MYSYISIIYYVVISYVSLGILCTQGSAENQIYTEWTSCLNITITITSPIRGLVGITQAFDVILAPRVIA